MPEHNDLAFDALHDLHELREIGRMLRNQPPEHHDGLRWAEWEEHEARRLDKFYGAVIGDPND